MYGLKSSVERDALQQQLRLWPSLHPQAHRAILLYTSTLLIEGLVVPE